MLVTRMQTTKFITFWLAKYAQYLTENSHNILLQTIENKFRKLTC